MRMKFLRILPETCARTWCLFSSSTLNMALGSGSITTAITSIASSLLIQLLKPVSPAAAGSPDPLWRPRFASLCWRLTWEDHLFRQNHRPILGHCHAVFEVGTITAVLGHRRPLIIQDACLAPADIHHWLDRQHHAVA